MMFDDIAKEVIVSVIASIVLFVIAIIYRKAITFRVQTFIVQTVFGLKIQKVTEYAQIPSVMLDGLKQSQGI